MSEDHLVPINLAAKILRVSRRTIFNYIKNGRLSSVKQGKNTLIAVREIEGIRDERNASLAVKSNNNRSLHLNRERRPASSLQAGNGNMATIQLDLASHVILKRNEYEQLIKQLARHETELARLKNR